MGKVSVELVPRSKENLTEQLHLIKDTFPTSSVVSLEDGKAP